MSVLLYSRSTHLLQSNHLVQSNWCVALVAMLNTVTLPAFNQTEKSVYFLLNRLFLF